MSRSRENRPEEYQRFSFHQRKEFRTNGISLEEACSYDDYYDAGDILRLWEERISSSVASLYWRHYFSPDDYLHGRGDENSVGLRKGCLPAKDIIDLVSAGIQPEQIRSYDERFHARHIIRLLEEGISAEEAHSFSDRLTGDDIVSLLEKKVNFADVARYPSWLPSSDLRILLHFGVGPEAAEQYTGRFRGEDIVALYARKVPASVALQYPEGFHGTVTFWGSEKMEMTHPDIEFYLINYSDPKVVLSTFPFIPFSSEEVARPKLVEDLFFYRTPTSRGFIVFNGIRGTINTLSLAELPRPDSFKELKYIGKRRVMSLRSPEGKRVFIQTNLTPRDEKSYEEYFGNNQLLEVLHYPDCLGKSNFYRITGEDIVRFHSMGVRPGQLTASSLSLLKIISSIETFRLHNPRSFKYLGVGSQAVVLLHRPTRSAHKFAADLSHEVSILERLVGRETNYVIRLEKDLRNDYGVLRELFDCCRIEYVPGETLDALLNEKTLSSEGVVAYGCDILKGLIELHEAGICHRDLHEKNVIIDEERDRAVIADLGSAEVAETYPVDPSDSRRHGAFDDIFSYGLLLYKMCTNRHLLMDFASTLSPGEREIPPDDIPFNSKASTYGNADWIAIHKYDILHEDGTIPERLKDYIQRGLAQKGHQQFTPLVIQTLGVIGYINAHLAQENQLTIAEMKQGKRVSYELVKPARERLFQELLTLLTP